MSKDDVVSGALQQQLLLAQTLTAQFGKELEAIRQLNACIGGGGLQQLAITKQIEAAMAPFRDASVQLSRVMLGVEREALQAGLRMPRIEMPDDLRRLLQDLARIQRLVGDALNDLPQRTRKELNGLAARGWYIDQELPVSAPGALLEALDDGLTSEVDEAFIGYYRERHGAIRERLLRQYPLRAPFLSKAFAAHERGDYELSIPVLLAQADGICKERTDRLMFRREGQRPEVASYVERTLGSDTYRAALLSPLAETHPISLSKAQRPAEFDGLNRHQVLHGESLTYHTEMNSLKAISLLSFLSWVLHFEDISSETDAT